MQIRAMCCVKKGIFFENWASEHKKPSQFINKCIPGKQPGPKKKQSNHSLWKRINLQLVCSDGKLIRTITCNWATKHTMQLFSGNIDEWWMVYSKKEVRKGINTCKTLNNSLVQRLETKKKKEDCARQACRLEKSQIFFYFQWRLQQNYTKDP